MRKFFSILLLVSVIPVFNTGFASPPTIKESYDSQIGVRELTGHNDGKEVKMYLKTVGLPEGYSWCAAFVKWNLIQANIPNTINAMALSCHRPGHLITPDQARAGDVFTLYYKKLKRIGHTGFFDKRINSSVYRTVEGNTNEKGSREGDGVYRRYRSFKATYSISRWD